jgi:hypothetical protein
MPHGGWTETVDSTEPVWLQRSSGSRISPPRGADRVLRVTQDEHGGDIHGEHIEPDIPGA